MQKNTFFCTVIICLTIMSSCSRRPGNVLDEQKMVDVLYDIQIAQAIYNSSEQDMNTMERKDALIAGVLDKHHVTKADFDSSLVWYSDNVQLYLNVNDSVVSRLKVKSDLLSKARDLADPNLNGNNNSILPSVFYLNAINATLPFKIDSLEMKAIDLSSFKLSFDVQGLNPVQSVKAGVYFTYKDTVIKQIIPIDDNIHYVLDKPQLPDSLLKNISGYIHLKKSPNNLLSNIVIYNIKYQDSIPVLDNEMEKQDKSISDVRSPLEKETRQTTPAEQGSQKFER